MCVHIDKSVHGIFSFKNILLCQLLDKLTCHKTKFHTFIIFYVFLFHFTQRDQRHFKFIPIRCAASTNKVNSACLRFSIDIFSN